MIIKIVGFHDESYTKKDTGELVEQVRIYFEQKAPADETYCGIIAGAELLTAKRCPDGVSAVLDSDNVIGSMALISKDTVSFNGSSYTYVDSFVLLDKATADRLEKGGA